VAVAEDLIGALRLDADLAARLLWVARLRPTRSLT